MRYFTKTYNQTSKLLSRIYQQINNFKKIKLINTLQNTLVQSLVRGTPQDKVVKEFAKKMNVSLSQAGRLIATETVYFTTIGEFDSLNNLGVKQL